MNKESLYKAFENKYEELKTALSGDDLDRMKQLTLEVHAMVHPAAVSGAPHRMAEKKRLSSPGWICSSCRSSRYRISSGIGSSAVQAVSGGVFCRYQPSPRFIPDPFAVPYRQACQPPST